MINDQNTPVICALATVSHLHLAVTMADSFVRHHKNGKVFILQIGGEKMSFPTRKYLSIVDLADLNAESELDSMRQRYSIFEFCNALKPYLLNYLLENTDYTKICYFDSDLYVLGNMDEEVWGKFDDCSVMLTPHYIKIKHNDEEMYQRELETIIRGVYNGGFVGVRNDENARQFVNWWKEKVFRGCYKRPEEGMYVDQRWLDIVPSFDIGVKINRHPGLNVAFWNLSERKISRAVDKYYVNEKPFLFFHISGYLEEKPDIVTKFNNLRFSDFPHLREIYDGYAEKLIQTKGELNQQLMKRVLTKDFTEEFHTQKQENAVSVIVSTSDNEKHNEQTIESVLRQTLSAEIIVIKENNAEIAAARNRAVEKAKGEFVIFLEAGNYFLFPTALEEQISVFRDINCAVVIGGWREIKENNTKSSEHLSWLDSPALTVKQLLQMPFIQLSTMMFRRSALLKIGGFDAEVYPFEFLDAALRLAQNGFSFEWMKRVITACQTDEKTSAALELRSEALKKLWQNFFQNEDLSPEIKRLQEKVRFESLVWAANRFYLAGDLPTMRKTLLESLNHTKLSPRGALVYWFSKFSRFARKERRHFDQFDLINSKEWRELENLQFGKPEEPFVAETRQSEIYRQKQFASAAFENGNASVKIVQTENNYAPKINLKQTFEKFVGKHRSGWNFALQSLLPLHRDDGIYFDGASDATFDAENQDLPPNLENGWIGLFHNPPEMPEWFAPTATQKMILESENFQNSLENCYGIFCLSETHRDWLAKQIDVPVAALLHPTETPKVKFSLKRFAENPEKRIVQIGHWARKLHSIYFLPTILKRCAVYQNFNFVQEIFEVEKEKFNFCVCDSEVETLPFLSDAEYDELLAENLVYVELYVASANNAVIECIVRNTPILVNPLPAVREYLGEDYPFYFDSRMEAAAKAEDFGMIAETHEYLKNLPIKEKLTAEYFLKSFAESEIYRRLPI